MLGGVIAARNQAIYNFRKGNELQRTVFNITGEQYRSKMGSWKAFFKVYLSRFTNYLFRVMLPKYFILKVKNSKKTRKKR